MTKQEGASQNILSQAQIAFSIAITAKKQYRNRWFKHKPLDSKVHQFTELMKFEILQQKRRLGQFRRKRIVYGNIFLKCTPTCRHEGILKSQFLKGEILLPLLPFCRHSTTEQQQTAGSGCQNLHYILVEWRGPLFRVFPGKTNPKFPFPPKNTSEQVSTRKNKMLKNQYCHKIQ